MYCANCGAENDDGAAFCSKCGKSPTGDTSNAVNQQNRQGGLPLSNFTAKMFSILFEIILWLMLIGGVVGGGILGKMFAPYRRDSGGYVFGGIILGGIGALIMIILTGGLVSLFIKLVNNSEEIKKKLK